MDIYQKILFNLNIIKNNTINYDLNKINFGFTKFILLKDNYNYKSKNNKGIPYYCENNNIPFIIKLFPKNNEKLLNIEIVYSTLFYKELSLITPNFISIYDYNYCIHNNKKCFSNLPLESNYTDILLYEYITEKDIDTFFFNKKCKLTIKVWKSILFQVIYNLCILQDKYSFIHNDLHPANILIDSINKNDVINYNFDNYVFYVPTYSYLVKFSDFEYSNIYNKKYINIKNNLTYLSKIGFSKIYDLHTFLIGILDHTNLPTELIDFINSLYPSKLLDKKFLSDGFLTPELIKEYHKELELTSPEKIIIHDFFKEYLTICAGNIYSFNYNSK